MVVAFEITTEFCVVRTDHCSVLRGLNEKEIKREESRIGNTAEKATRKPFRGSKILGG